MGKFIINKTKTGYTFALKASNGETIGIGGEVFSSLESCKNSIQSVIKNAPEANFEDQTVEGYEAAKHPKFELYNDKAGEFRFRLKARNGEPILAGEGYTAKASCKNGIDSVRRNVVDADIVEPEE
ncbi:MAG: DUF1508 domain-containing protein [Ruminococcaceae bacterium]|nr:DUF1508 domain-containing protein [Oscillospiraceae bacterium]